MDGKEVEQYLIDFQEKALPELVPRNLAVPPSKKITVIIGPRRAGKTSYLFQIMQQLLRAGKKKEDLLYLNFEHTKLLEVGFKDIKRIAELNQELYSSSRQVIFLDEVQNVPFWEKAVRELYEEGATIYITGSSSKLLSKEIATSLRGRSLSYILLPFSFIEFLQLRKAYPSSLVSSKDKTRISALLREFLELGGFPEVILEENREVKTKILENYFELTVFKDIIERYKVRDSFLVKWFIKSMAASYTKEVSIHKMYLTLKSQNRSIGKEELYSYASMCNDSLFIFYLPKFSWSIRKREPVHKAYLSDVGFSKITEVTPDRGKKMENTVFLELARKLKPLQELFYWKNTQQEEVDFVVKAGAKIQQLIQVCANPESLSREVRALLKASKELQCPDLTVITEELEKEEKAAWHQVRGNIKYIPLWKWLLRLP